MTTPAGVPNLPLGALTVATLGGQLQDQTTEAMRLRANERIPDIFASSTGGDIAADLSPFGILANIWSGVNSLIANADPADIQGPEDIPDLLLEFIEGLPLIGPFVALLGDLLAVLQGEYDGEDELLLAIQAFLAPLLKLLHYIFGGFIADFLDNDGVFLKPLFDWLQTFWGLFGEVVETLLNPLGEIIKWGWDLLEEIVGTSADEVLRNILSAIEWVWRTFGVPVMKALGGLGEWISSVINFDTLRQVLEDIVGVLGKVFNLQGFVDVFTTVIKFFGGLISDITNFNLTDFLLQLPVIGTIVAVITGKNPADGDDPGLGTLGVWARDMEKKAREAKETIDDIGQKLLGGLFPVSQINFSEPNLLSQGNFNVSETIDGADGWEWDSSITATGSGGSAMFTSAGTLGELFSKQSIRVTEGDKLTLSAAVRTTGFTSGSMVLTLIPWSGTSRWTDSGPSSAYRKTMATRSTASSGSWATVSGSWTIPAGITSVQVSLRADVNSGAVVRFDDIYLRKTGAMGQTLVDRLVDTWRAIVENITGEPADIFWDAVGEAIGFLTGTANDAEQAIGAANTILFGDPDGGTEVVLGALPTQEIGATINPGAGSGALLIRSASDPVAPSWGRNVTPNGFFTSLSVGSSDIDCLKTDGTPGTGTRGDYAGAFRVGMDGWYMVELSIRLNVGFGTGAFSCCPVLYKGTSLGGCTAYKVGTDVQYNWLGATAVQHRFVQNTWIVYLAEDDIVRAGADTAYAGLDPSSAALGGESSSGTSGVETYFSISLLNRSFE